MKFGMVNILRQRTEGGRSSPWPSPLAPSSPQENRSISPDLHNELAVKEVDDRSLPIMPFGLPFDPHHLARLQLCQFGPVVLSKPECEDRLVLGFNPVVRTHPEGVDGLRLLVYRQDSNSLDSNHFPGHDDRLARKALVGQRLIGRLGAGDIASRDQGRHCLILGRRLRGGSRILAHCFHSCGLVRPRRKD